MTQQIAQLVMWIGVIMIIPAFYRFCYASSALIWRKIFPTKTFEVRFRDEENHIDRTITITLPKDKSKTLVSLIDEAVGKAQAKNG